MCQPIAALGGRQVDAVVVGGIGGGALKKLRDAEIMVYRAMEGTIAENMEMIRSKKLPEFNMTHTCAGHHGNIGCAH